MPRPVDIKKTDFLRRHLPANGKTLELGCGEGLVMVSLPGFDITGVEIDADEVSKARARGFSVEQGDARTWSNGERFDAVIASEVIEHLPDPETLLENICRNLKPGGTLLLTTPNGFGPYELRHHLLNPIARLRRWNWLRARLGREPFVAGGFTHAQFFTWGRLTKLIEDAGFTIFASSNSDALLGGLNAPERIATLDVQIADRLPRWLASGWYIASRMNS